MPLLLKQYVDSLKLHGNILIDDVNISYDTHIHIFYIKARQRENHIIYILIYRKSFESTI